MKFFQNEAWSLKQGDVRGHQLVPGDLASAVYFHGALNGCALRSFPDFTSDESGHIDTKDVVLIAARLHKNGHLWIAVITSKGHGTFGWLTNDVLDTWKQEG